MPKRDDATINAAFQEQSIAQWRDWRLYLALHLRLLDLRGVMTTTSEDAFEIGAQIDPEQDVREQIAAIPVAARTVFDQAVAERREIEQRRFDAEQRERGERLGQPTDADAVDRVTLTVLLEDADGLHNPAGIGVVPLADGWYDVDAERLRNGIPDQAAYRIRGGTKQLGLPQIAAGVGIIVAAIAAIWFTMPHTAPVARAATAVALYVDATAVAPWTPRSAVFTTQAASAAPVPLLMRSAYTGDAGGWYDPAAWPLTLCAPATVPYRDVTQVMVAGAADAPSRTYDVGPAATGAADIALVPCAGSGQPRYGVLREVAPPAVLALGQAAQLPDNRSVTLTALQMIGPADNAQLPPGKAEVLATVTASGMDWSKVNASLAWPDGQEVLPSSSTPAEKRVVFRYLVPLPDTQINAVQWRVIDPTTAATVRWQSALDVPRSRVQLLTDALRDVRVQATTTDTNDTQIAIDLTNAGDTPLQLRTTDIVLTQNDQPQPVPALAALRDPMQPGETRTILFTLAGSSRQALTVRIGTAIYTIGP